MDLAHEDVQSILKIIDVAEHLEEIEIVHGEFRLHVVRNSSVNLHAQPQAVPQVEQQVIAHANFKAGRVTTRWVEERFLPAVASVEVA